MTDRLSAFSWSIPVGRLFLTQIRVSVLFVPIALILGYRLGWQVGLAFSGLLMVSILAHELGHVLAARWTGGYADEILLWPMGGLAFAQPGPHPSSMLITIAGGPAVNLLACLLFFPGFYATTLSWSLLSPVEIPIAEFTAANWGREVCHLAFTVNWILLLINLLPIYPLDGGQFLHGVLAQRLPSESAYRLAANVGNVCSWLLMGLGLMYGLMWVVVIGALTLVLGTLLTTQGPGGESYDDSFLGYDFSQGYTSLERSERSSRKSTQPGWWERWREDRRSKRQAREAAEREALEQQLDLLLAKVHEQGMDALTNAERRQLKQASESLRGRTRPPSQS
ncbi:MAG TPA: site-2 protease family protein [Planctomycetaceae bacterium]|nr:site-2 protease family protein [Planctomycetaceae bacterium]